jgi:HAD superfamily hydrolase (TIGR01509 family)
MDGIIIDSETMYRIAWQRAAHEMGFELDDELYASLLGFTIPDAEAALGRAFGPQFPVAKFHDIWPGYWRNLVEIQGMPVKPGLGKFLDVVNEHRLPVAVATSSDAEVAAFSLRAAGLDGRFSCIVSGDQVANGKPAPDIFLEASRRLEVSPQFCIVVEDSEAGILAAFRAGMFSIFIPDLKPPSPHTVKLAHRIFHSLDEAAEFLKEVHLPIR